MIRHRTNAPCLATVLRSDKGDGWRGLRFGPANLKRGSVSNESRIHSPESVNTEILTPLSEFVTGNIPKTCAGFFLVDGEDQQRKGPPAGHIPHCEVTPSRRPQQCLSPTLSRRSRLADRIALLPLLQRALPHHHSARAWQVGRQDRQEPGSCSGLLPRCPHTKLVVAHNDSVWVACDS